MAECRSLRLASLNGLGAVMLLISACAYAFEPEPPAAVGQYAITMAHLLTCRTSPGARADAVRWLRRSFGEVHATGARLGHREVHEPGAWDLDAATDAGQR
jgi:hypothetical protein